MNDELIRLSELSLPDLAERGLTVPEYDRGQVRAGIVHFGVGGFHRAHQALYLDELMSEGKAMDWGIVGMGVLPGDARMRDALAGQDYLYTLATKHPDGTWDGRIIGSIIDFVHAPDDPDRAVEVLADPNIRVVSLTITEGGYNVDAETGGFDENSDAVRADLAAARGQGSEGGPQTVFGLVTEALRRRRSRGDAAFTIVSCDNIPGNGRLARQQFIAFAQLVDPELGTWVKDNVHFPDSMVDRITPVTTDADRERIASQWGVDDAAPVVCEPFRQWALEDDFPAAPGEDAARPPWEEVGVSLVDDVEPFEKMKLRLLNSSHQAMCYLGYLAGYRYAHEVAQDEDFARFLLDYMNRDATPTLEDVPGVDLEQYKHQLIERFANPEVQDTLARLCAESSDRIPQWLRPVIEDNLADDGAIENSALVVASWARYAQGEDEQGQPIDVVDRRRERVMAAAAPSDDELAFLRDRELFGALADDERFAAAYRSALESLRANGARATVVELNERLAD